MLFKCESLDMPTCEKCDSREPHKHSTNIECCNICKAVEVDKKPRKKITKRKKKLSDKVFDYCCPLIPLHNLVYPPE